MNHLVRGVVGVLIGVAIALAYALLDALLDGPTVAEQLSSPVFWVVTGVSAVIAGLVVMDKGDDTPKAEKSRDRIAGEQLLWALGAVLVIGILIGLVTRTPILEVMASPAFWIPAGFAILAAGLEPYRDKEKAANDAAASDAAANDDVEPSPTSPT